MHKILTHIVSFLYMSLVFLFFAAIYFAVASIFSFDINNLYLLISGHLGENLYVVVFQYGILILLGITFFYAHFLLIPIYRAYIQKKKLPVFSKRYVDWKSFLKYLGAMGYLFGIFIIFNLVFVAIIWMVSLLFGGPALFADQLESGNLALFPNLLLVFTIVFLFLFLYVIYRTIFIFAYMIEKNIGPKEAFFLSINNTKGRKKIFQTVVVFLLFSVFYLPFASVNTGLKKNEHNLLSYININAKVLKQEKLTEREILYAQKYTQLYKGLSMQEVMQLYKTVQTWQSWFTIISFLLFTGYFTMLYTSVFTRIINKK